SYLIDPFDLDNGVNPLSYRIGPGSGNHWSDQFSSEYRDYFLMSGSGFEDKWGQSVGEYRNDLYIQAAHRSGDAVTFNNLGFYSHTSIDNGKTWENTGWTDKW